MSDNFYSKISFFKKLGYKYTKDPNGMYFDKDNIRISVMKCGPIYNCYINEFKSGKFVLIEKQLNLLNLEFVNNWMMTKIH